MLIEFVYLMDCAKTHRFLAWFQVFWSKRDRINFDAYENQENLRNFQIIKFWQESKNKLELNSPVHWKKKILASFSVTFRSRCFKLGKKRSSIIELGWNFDYNEDDLWGKLLELKFNINLSSKFTDGPWCLIKVWNGIGRLSVSMQSTYAVRWLEWILGSRPTKGIKKWHLTTRKNYSVHNIQRTVNIPIDRGRGLFFLKKRGWC